VGEKEDN